MRKNKESIDIIGQTLVNLDIVNEILQVKEIEKGICTNVQKDNNVCHSNDCFCRKYQNKLGLNWAKLSPSWSLMLELEVEV